MSTPIIIEIKPSSRTSSPHFDDAVLISPMVLDEDAPEKPAEVKEPKVELSKSSSVEESVPPENHYHVILIDENPISIVCGTVTQAKKAVEAVAKNIISENKTFGMKHTNNGILIYIHTCILDFPLYSVSSLELPLVIY